MSESRLFQTVRKVFAGEGWEFEPGQADEEIVTGREMFHTRVVLRLRVFAPQRAVTVMGESAFATDTTSKLAKLAELVTRLNMGLMVGNFELDWELGKVMFRITNLFPNDEGDEQIIRGMVLSALGEMDRISPMESAVQGQEGASLAMLDLEDLIARVEADESAS